MIFFHFQVHTQANKLSVVSSKAVRQRSNKLQDERQRLQKLEEELRQRLDSMKKLSEAKQQLLGKLVPKHNLDTSKKLENASAISTVNDSPKKKPSYSVKENKIEVISKNNHLDFRDTREMVGNDGNETNFGNSFDINTRSDLGSVAMEDMSRNNDLDCTDTKKTVSNKDIRTNSRNSFGTKAHGDIGLVPEARIESKLNSFFQDQEKWKHIMQEQVGRIILSFGFVLPSESNSNFTTSCVV